MRLGWATGEAGMVQSMSMLGIATVVTMLTGLSLSAIATNGLQSVFLLLYRIAL